MDDTDLIERANQMKDWPDWLRQELERNRFDGHVGQRLVSETDRVRVWLIRLRPGERLPLHRHVLDYFWTATTAGAARSHVFGGGTVERVYTEGETQHQHFGSRAAIRRSRVAVAAIRRTSPRSTVAGEAALRPEARRSW